MWTSSILSSFQPMPTILSPPQPTVLKCYFPKPTYWGVHSQKSPAPPLMLWIMNCFYEWLILRNHPLPWRCFMGDCNYHLKIMIHATSKNLKYLPHAVILAYSTNTYHLSFQHGFSVPQYEHVWHSSAPNLFNSWVDHSPINLKLQYTSIFFRRGKIVKENFSSRTC